MKNPPQPSVCVIAGVALLAGVLPLGAASFTEDFESGLGQWTGKAGGSHHGILVADPLASGHGTVLSFSDLAYGGDLFTAHPIWLSGPTVISFDYLGLAIPCSVPGDLGGFLGVARHLDPGPTGSGNVWYAGTQDSYPGLAVLLTDDGVWHHYEITVDATALGPFRLILEDFAGSGGTAGDAYFDNLSVAPAPNSVPEPTLASFAVIGVLASFAFRQRRP